eukprot:gnl/MRDRNA2_/MRDRNA2_232457_c0_seq1.p1 gnl/MRDRNA2_/MRDRNA2_232457_c0~~gnl/MRDRNA2_/MRDRNA2_232457_c0_seq1.p1  ORF type:complete len:198 (+),score=24.37 gnl/MRDRNA2_/MRDRNA2_232457_c0_seq1:86-595(+)
MVDALKDANATGATLSSWYIYDKRCSKFGYVDAEAMDWKAMALIYGWNETTTEATKNGWIYGYGFSHVYLRNAAIKEQFPDQNMSEDYYFFLRLGLQGPLLLINDTFGLCLHTLHLKNTVFSPFVTRDVSEQELSKLEVAKIFPLLKEYFQPEDHAGILSGYISNFRTI